MLEKEQGAVVDARQTGAEAAVMAQRLVLFFDIARLLLPLHSKRRVCQHVIERDLLAVLVFGKTVFGEPAKAGKVPI